jgi:hypothetical protein
VAHQYGGGVPNERKVWVAYKASNTKALPKNHLTLFELGAMQRRGSTPSWRILHDRLQHPCSWTVRAYILACWMSCWTKKTAWSEVLAQFTEQVDVQWRTGNLHSLTKSVIFALIFRHSLTRNSLAPNSVRDDTSWRFHKDQTFQARTTILTAGDFYKLYSQLLLRAAYLNNPPTRWKHLTKVKGDLLLPVELWIDVGKVGVQLLPPSHVLL